MALIESRLRAALSRSSKLERRAEIAINDGKMNKAIDVLNDLRIHASKNLNKAKGLLESLKNEEYSSESWEEFVDGLLAFKSYAEERLLHIKLLETGENTDNPTT